MRCMRILRESEMPRYREHLLCLDTKDRRMRFGSSLDNAGIEAHVQHLRERADRILALLDEFGSVVAAVHIALLEPAAAELGVTVDRRWRGRGVGRALFEQALAWLRCRGIRRVFLVFLSENRAMRALARAFGMSTQNDAGEMTAELTLPLPTPFSVLWELIVEFAGLWPAALRLAEGDRVFDLQPGIQPSVQPAV